jgi:hypothetical protein
MFGCLRPVKARVETGSTVSEEGRRGSPKRRMLEKLHFGLESRVRPGVPGELHEPGLVGAPDDEGCRGRRVVERRVAELGDQHEVDDVEQFELEAFK